MKRLLITLAALWLITGTAPAVADGGPDLFGYVWQNYPTFTWVEANDSGTAVHLVDDEVAGPFPIGFDFDFYGETYSQFYVSANGRLMFEEQPETFKIPCIPSTAPYLNYIALYWDDLDPETSGVVYYETIGTEPDRLLIVEWDHVMHFGSTTDTVTAEIVLAEKTAHLALQYLDPSDELGAGATVGMMSPDGTDGLSIVCNQAVLSPNQNIFIQHPAYVELTANDPYAAVFEGQTAHFDLFVRNVTGVDANFVTTFSGNSWTAQADPGVIFLAAGETGEIGVNMEVPTGTTRWSYDDFEVKVTSAVNPSVSATAALSAIAGPDWVVHDFIVPTAVQESSVVTDTEWVYVFSNYLAPGIVGTLSRFRLDGTVETLPSLTPAVNAADGSYLWGKLVFPGGVDETGQITDQLYVYDISEAAWTVGYPLPKPLAYAATVVLDDMLYVIGGFDGEEPLSTLYRFSPDTASWWRLTPMNYARVRPAAGVVDGKIVVAGGFNQTALDVVEVYDPQTDSWTDGAPLPVPLRETADATCNDTFYVIGGSYEDAASNAVYGYNLAGDRWFPISRLQTARFSTEATLLDGSIVVAGGMSELFSPLDSAEAIALNCVDEEHVIDLPFGTDDDTATDDDTEDDDTEDDDTEGDDDTEVDDDDTEPTGNDDDDDDDGCCGC